MEFLKAGGVPMYLIMLCSVVALAVIIERAVRIELARTDLGALLRPVASYVSSGKAESAVRHCDSIDKPAARLCKEALGKRSRPREEIRTRLEDAADRELAVLGRRLEVVGVIAHVTPLLGLLGTVMGMIRAFRRIQEAGGGPVDQQVLSGGIWQALLTTAAGLSVAIPVYIAYKVLQGRVARHAEEMDRVASDCLEMLGGDGAEKG